MVVEARAKLNLGLAVGPRRADGFHDLATVFQSVALADTLTVTRRRSGFSLAVRFENVAARGGVRSSRARSAVPAGRDNLVLRAARLLAARGLLTGGARFTLVKRIPAGAGLGGGSADAAAALTALGRLYDLQLPSAAWLSMAAELGSDVPFAMFGGTSLGLGRGERLSQLHLARPFRVVIALPDWRIATAGAYRALDRRKYRLTGWGAHLRFAEALGREAIRPERAMRLGNVFETVLGKHRSGFLSLCERLKHAGAVEPHLTGSGSAVFGIVPAGVPGKRIIDRFVGSEAIFLTRSRGTGLTHNTLQ
ncbi:MAG TPA: 4-(cytidine 5'-diphospho)-2-C-methyl-D-erythritol kinase [Candidatus Eisenbacteria bacterium]|nr:4-(cytidine 5'-diphospho)-2-C-methyl-D-erythritol kinase [Candidatus Eisenbacteria bacterium]